MLITRNYVCALSLILGYGNPRLFKASEAALLSDEVYRSSVSATIRTTSRQSRSFLMLSIVLPESFPSFLKAEAVMIRV
ncbi:MAG: hypothetical protein ACP5NK_07250 [Thermoplasmata archaeon]